MDVTIKGMQIQDTLYLFKDAAARAIITAMGKKGDI